MLPTGTWKIPSLPVLIGWVNLITWSHAMWGFKGQKRTMNSAWKQTGNQHNSQSRVMACTVPILLGKICPPVSLLNLKQDWHPSVSKSKWLCPTDAEKLLQKTLQEVLWAASIQDDFYHLAQVYGVAIWGCNKGREVLAHCFPYCHMVDLNSSFNERLVEFVLC